MKKLLLGLALVCLLMVALGGTAGAQPPALTSLAMPVASGSPGLFAPAWITPRDVSSPTCSAIAPAAAPNDRDTAVTITGTGFATDLTGTIPPTVTLGTTPLKAVTFVSATSLTATVPLGMTAGAYDLTVTNPDTGSATLTSAYTVRLPLTVTTIDPVTAGNASDTAVTITGTGFANDPSGTIPPYVRLGTTWLIDVIVVDSTTLTATVPWGIDPGLYTLSVNVPGQHPSAVLTDAFTVTPTHTIRSIDPQPGLNDRDNVVTIRGTGFATDLTGTIAPTVSLGTTPLTGVTFVNATTLTATVPWGIDPGTYDLTVTNPDGSSVTRTGAFAVAPTHTIRAIIPAAAPNDRDNVVTIRGTGFATDPTGMIAPTVTLGTTPLTGVTFVGTTTLTATVPGWMDSGLYALTVTNPDGSSVSLTDAFTVTPTHAIRAISPASALNDRDTAVTITGTGFATDPTGMIAPTVTLGTTPLTGVTFVNAKTLTATVPMGLTSGLYALTVTNPDGSSVSLTDAFTVMPTPTVSAVDPATADNDVDTAVTITGTGFATDLTGAIAPTASLGTTPLTDVTWVSTTTLTATVPWGIDPGLHALTVTNPDGGRGSLSGAFTVTPTHTVRAIVPTSAPNDRDTAVTITGTGFATDATGTIAPTVSLGTTSLTDVTFVNATRLTATVPQGIAPGLYALTVTNPDGSSVSLSDAFTVTPAPTVSAVDPATADNGIDTSVTITGTDFATDPTGTIAPTASLGTTALTGVTFVNATTLTATVPWGIAPGLYALTVTNPDGGSGSLTDAFTVTQTHAVGAIAPVSAYNDIDTAVTITGIGFATDPTGTVPPSASLSNTASGSVPLTNVAFVDAATLTATVPWGMDPGSYDLTVTNPDSGKASLHGAFTVEKGIGTWNGGKLYGGGVGRVQMKPGDGSTLYASADGIGVFRSKDAGEHWTFIGGDFGIQDVILDPLHPTWLYADGLCRSKDEGDTWTSVYRPPHPSGAEFFHWFPSPYDPKTLFLAISGWDTTVLGLRKSTDGGASWDVVKDMQDYSVALLAFHPTDPAQMVLATTGGRVFRSTDGGDHWSQAARPPVGADAGPNLIAYNPYRPAEVWIFWFDSDQITKSTGDPISGWQVTSLGVSSYPFIRFTAADEVYIAGAHTTDGGTNWQSSYGQEILSDPVDPRICYRADFQYGVMKSSDGGGIWAPSNQGLSAMYCNSMAVSPTDPERVFATFVGWPGIFRSDDGTSHWTNLQISGDAGATEMPLVREDPFDPHRLYAALGNGLFVSSTEGESWTPLGWTTRPASLVEGPSGCFETDPFYAGHLLIGLRDTVGTAHLYSSTDSGVSWQVAGPPALGGFDAVNDIRFDPDTAGLVYVVGAKGMYRSTDDGASWQRIDDKQMGMANENGGGVIRIATHPRQVLTVYATGRFMSFDGGDTWQDMDVDDDKMGDLLFVGHDSTRMYSGSPIGLFFSSDLGHDFTRAAGVLGRLHITILGSATANDHVIIYAATTGGEVHAGAASPAAVGTRSAAARAGTFVGGGVYRWTVAISRVTLGLDGLTSGALRLGHPVTASGIVTPARLVSGKVAITVQNKKAGRWITVKAVRRTIAAAGVYRWKYWPAKRGAYRLRATIARTSTHTSAKTAWRTFRVR